MTDTGTAVLRSSSAAPAANSSGNLALQPGSQYVQLGLAHGSFEAEQQTIVEVRRIINAVFIENESVGESADFQQPVPVRGVSRKSGNFQTQHDAGFAQTHFRNELLKALPIDRRCTGLSE